MKSGAPYYVVFVTVPDRKTARTLARVCLEKRLVACANLISAVESHYWWQGKLESSQEILMLFKTTRKRLPKLEQTILAHHPYDTPEMVALSLTQGNARYLEWIQQSTASSPSSRQETMRSHRFLSR